MIKKPSNLKPEESVSKLGQLIKGIKFAMLTTVDEKGNLHSRPMATQEMEFDGELWFFTALHSHKIDELRRNPRVNLSYVDTKAHRYISVSGHCQVVHDTNKAKELWSPAFKTWFPNGLNDPDLCLLKVTVDAAEYWDSPASSLVYLVGFAKAVLTGKRPGALAGDHQEIHH